MYIYIYIYIYEYEHIYMYVCIVSSEYTSSAVPEASHLPEMGTNDMTPFVLGPLLSPLLPSMSVQLSRPVSSFTLSIHRSLGLPLFFL